MCIVHVFTTCQAEFSPLHFVFPVILTSTLRERYHSHHFTGEVTEAQGGEVSCPKASSISARP